MNPMCSGVRARVVRASILLASLLLLGGCYDKRFQWSPDGRRLTVVTNEGLHLSDSDGRLSPLLLPAVEVAAWLSDSKRLVVSTSGGSLAIARIEGDTLAMGSLLYRGRTAVDMRVAPGDRHLAFTIDSINEQLSQFLLYVVPTDGSAEPSLVSQRAAAFPDWSVDGRELTYLEASGGREGEDELRLGTLVRRVVVDESGRIEVDSKSAYLAAVMFNALSRVRCLQDGRVVFNALEVSFPFASNDAAYHEQLFMADPERHPTLIRLISRERRQELPTRQLSFFEVSPDGRRVLVGTPEGDVQILTLSSGVVETVQSAGLEAMEGAPVWRPSGGITYLKRLQEDREERPGEIVYLNGDEETVLSADWTAEFMVELADYKSPTERKSGRFEGFRAAIGAE